jgi:diguanylate cyclase (GGDEF)-like protein
MKDGEIEGLRDELARTKRLLATEIEDRLRAEASFKLNEERLDALLQLSERRESSVEELAQFAIDESVRLTGSTIGYIHFVNPSEDGFLSYVWSNGSREVCAAVEVMDYSIHSAGIWADALRFKRPIVHNDYPNEPSRHGLPAGHIPLSRHMGVPVLKGGKVVAVSGVANKSLPYDGSDLRQLVLFANRLWSIVESKRAEAELSAANAELSRLANLDGLTGIANRRALDHFLELQWKVAVRELAPISLLMLDIDDFKAYNDAYGHQAGDEALKRVAGAIAASARRPTDLAARYGGEEFVLVLMKTEAESALDIARSIVSEVGRLGIPHEGSGLPGRLSVSAGVSSVIPSREGPESPDRLLAEADAALYEAKRLGKNRAALGG